MDSSSRRLVDGQSDANRSAAYYDARAGRYDEDLTVKETDRIGFGVYMPAIAVSSPISPERFEKQYHRRRHCRRGRFLAPIRLPRLEATRTGSFDVPAHTWRSCAREGLATILGTLLRRRAGAFHRLCDPPERLRRFSDRD